MIIQLTGADEKTGTGTELPVTPEKEAGTEWKFGASPRFFIGVSECTEKGWTSND
jgi:hypothetical protein